MQDIFDEQIEDKKRRDGDRDGHRLAAEKKISFGILLTLLLIPIPVILLSSVPALFLMILLSIIGDAVYGGPSDGSPPSC